MMLAFVPFIARRREPDEDPLPSFGALLRRLVKPASFAAATYIAGRNFGNAGWIATEGFIYVSGSTATVASLAFEWIAPEASKLVKFAMPGCLLASGIGLGYVDSLNKGLGLWDLHTRTLNAAAPYLEPGAKTLPSFSMPTKEWGRGMAMEFDITRRSTLPRCITFKARNGQSVLGWQPVQTQCRRPDGSQELVDGEMPALN